MSFGSTTQVINANRVKISRAGTELQLASDVKFHHTRVRDRTETRAGAIDTFRWRLETIEAIVAITELLLTQLQTDAGISAQSAKTYNNWTIAGDAISGVGGDNTSDTVSATLVDYDENAPEAGLGQVKIVLVRAGGAD